MPLEIHPATPLDAPALTAVFLAAFDDDFNHALFPRTADVREWWTVKFTHEVSQPGQVVLKVVDASSASCASDHEEIVAFAIWTLPSTTADLSACANQEDDDEDEVSWPASADASLCSRFFGQMAKKRKMYMGSRPHYCTSTHNTLMSLQPKIYAKQNRPGHTRNTPKTSRPWDSLSIAEVGS